MVKVYFWDAWWGGRISDSEKCFSSVNAFLDYLLDKNNFKYSYMDFNKDKVNYYCHSDNGYSERSSSSDRFVLDCKTHDQFGLYIKMIQRIDVDGKCFLNKEKKENGVKYIVTNSFVEQIFKPFVQKVTESKKVTYAD